MGPLREGLSGDVVIPRQERPYDADWHLTFGTTVNAAPITALAPRREELDKHSLELRPIPKAAAAANNHGLPPSLLTPREPRRRVLTHEEEVALSQRIETGERDALQALLGSPQAAAPLRNLAAELRDARVLPSQIMRNAPEEADGKENVDRLARLLDRAAAAASSVPTAKDAATRERRRKRLERISSELAVEQFERSVFDRLARRLKSRQSDERARRAFARGLRQAQSAVHEFVGANFGLVVTYARRFVGQGLDMHDLVQEGHLGLIRAVEKFDWRRGHRFSTYAAWWVRQAMARALADQSKTIRVPVHLLESRQKLERVRRSLEQRGRRNPTTSSSRARAACPSTRSGPSAVWCASRFGSRRLSATTPTAASSAIAWRTPVSRARRAHREQQDADAGTCPARAPRPA